MKAINRKRIAQYADEVRRILEIPYDRIIDLDEVLEKLDIQLIIDEKIPYEGKVVVEENDGKIMSSIYLKNNFSNIGRKRFTIAHELGHLFLHQKFEEGIFKDSVFYRNLKFTTEELEANEFAANLLMPKVHFIEVLESGKTIEEIADIFNVSLQAVINRKRFLNG